MRGTCLGRGGGALAEEGFLESHGSEYIDLGYCSRPQNKVEVHFTYTSTTKQQRLFGNDYDAAGSDRLSFSSYQNGSDCYAFTGQNGVGAWQTFNGNAGYAKVVPGERRILTIDLPGKTATLTDLAETFTYTSTVSGSQTQTNAETMSIFAGRERTYRSCARIYAFKLYESGELIRYLVPYSNGTTVGLRDVLSGTVYENQGGGAFTMGGDLGVCAGYNAAELEGKTLASGYEVIDGKLYDASMGWRKNGETLEFRVRATGLNGDVTLDGTRGQTVEKWYAYGASHTVSFAATPQAAWSFSHWSGSTATFTYEQTRASSGAFSVAGPADLTAHCRAADDVYASATVWLRGPNDLNGNGLVDDGEAISAVDPRKPYTTLTPHNDAIISNEWVAMPFRGGKRLMPTLYFPQTVTITNEALQSGTGRPSTVGLAGFTSLAGVTTNEYSFAIRFRPDNSQYRNDYAWLLNWGYSNQASGFNLGLYEKSLLTNRFVVSEGVTNIVPYRTYSMTLFKSGQSVNVLSTFGEVVYGGFWHDLIISIDGRNKKIRAVLSRAGWDPDLFPCTSSQASDNGSQNVWTNEVAMNEYDGSKYVNFLPTANLIFGSESTRDGSCVYANKGKTDGIYTKCYRGSIQQFAVWNRPLTFDEMKQAIAGPRPDVMRVGVRDGAADELRGGAGCDQDALEWTVPSALAAGEQTTLTFVIDRKGEEEQTQMLRVFATGDSATGTLKAAINGVDLGERTLEPCGKAEWRVRPNTLAAVTSTLLGSTNTLVLTRTDSGTTPLVFDAFALGGSVQIGHKDSSYMEFAHEIYSVGTHDVLNANTYEIKRVYFGARQNAEGKRSSNTNMLFTFTIPQEFQGGRYGFTLGWKDHTSVAHHQPRWRLNGHDLGYTQSADAKYHTLALPDAWLNDAANTLEFYNDSEYKNGDYYSLDYWRIDIKPRYGVAIFFR